MHVHTQAKAGFVMKVLSIVIITAAVNTWGQLCFDMSERPWQNHDVANITSSNFTTAANLTDIMG
jgi:hypothetical protein